MNIHEKAILVLWRNHLRRQGEYFDAINYGDPALRSSITTDAAVDECLFAPTAVLRKAKTSGEVAGCPFRRGSLFILELGSASKGAANRDLVFLSQSWSHCPAEKWVRALLEGVWTRVLATLQASEKPRGAS